MSPHGRIADETRHRRALRAVVVGGGLFASGMIAFGLRSEPGWSSYLPLAAGSVLLLRGMFVINT